MTGVYTITCHATQNVYVGSSLDIPARFHQHRCRLRNGTHKNSLLLTEFREHGEDSLSFRTIVVCDTIQRAQREEALWIREYEAAGKSLNLLIPPATPNERIAVEQLSRAQAAERCAGLLRFDCEADFLALLEHFIVASGMTATALGKATMNDPNFVFDVRKGARTCTLRLAFQVRDYIKSQLGVAA